MDLELIAIEEALVECCAHLDHTCRVLTHTRHGLDRIEAADGLLDALPKATRSDIRGKVPNLPNLPLPPPSVTEGEGVLSWDTGRGSRSSGRESKPPGGGDID